MINIIRKIIISLIAMAILTLVFFQNDLWAKVIILPFLFCSITFFGENVALILNKEKLSNIFKYIFRISFFVYTFGFLSYMIYYSITNKSYSVLIVVAVFLPFTIHFLKKSIFSKNKK